MWAWVTFNRKTGWSYGITAEVSAEQMPRSYRHDAYEDRMPTRHHHYPVDTYVSYDEPDAMQSQQQFHQHQHKPKKHHRSHKDYDLDHDLVRHSERKRKHADEWFPEDLIDDHKKKKKHKKHSRSRSRERRSRHEKRRSSPKCTDIEAFKFRSSLLSELSKKPNFTEKILRASKSSEPVEAQPVEGTICPLTEVPLPPTSDQKQTEATPCPDVGIPLDEIALPPEPVSAVGSGATWNHYILLGFPALSNKIAQREEAFSHRCHSNETRQLTVEFFHFFSPSLRCRRPIFLPSFHNV
ncbi:hypothetical protein CSKR_105885 [Clonorchis sinensis]|uniref:Uncharacterized protein n=1 Tax=Clonorchis sinensis TaxID=79923 RepID=A0A8T1N1C4_CLOSI|nr:hypothetical protein CSKR_105885 [Clonorchis sinensis]